MKQLLSDPKLFPAELWKGSFDAMEKNIEGVGEFTEAQLLREVEEDESERDRGSDNIYAILLSVICFLSFDHLLVDCPRVRWNYYSVQFVLCRISYISVERPVKPNKDLLDKNFQHIHVAFMEEKK